MLLSIAISIVSAAMLVAAAVIPGVTLRATGFVVAVLVFTIAQASPGPFVFDPARQYASAVLGGTGLASTFVALFVATLFADGLQISGSHGLGAGHPGGVWLITALGTWILGVVIIKRWWERRQSRSTAHP